jgi:hypothetical protein
MKKASEQPLKKKPINFKEVFYEGRVTKIFSI